MNLFELILKAAGLAARPKRCRGIQKSETRNQKSGRYPTPIVIDRGKRVDGGGRIIKPKTVRSQRTLKRVAAWKVRWPVTAELKGQ